MAGSVSISCAVQSNILGRPGKVTKQEIGGLVAGRVGRVCCVNFYGNVMDIRHCPFSRHSPLIRPTFTGWLFGLRLHRAW